jgi:hypothetical protein
MARQIGRSADASHGEQRKALNGSSLGGIYGESYCLFRLGKGEDGQLARFLQTAVTELTPLKSVFDGLRATGGKVMFGVLWSEGPRGDVLGADLLLSIAELGFDLGIEPISAA